MTSQGSGWAYNGYIITAKHVVDGFGKVDIFTDDSVYSVPGTVYYTDPELDITQTQNLMLRLLRLML